MALSATSILITLLGAEVVLRSLGPDRLRSLETGRELLIQRSQNPDLRYELRPNARVRVWGIDVAINSSGFRGPEIDPEKGSRRRILILGDSITFGNRLPEAVVYPTLLARRLGLAESGTQILNFGVGGYDVLQQVALLEHRGLRFQPDMVVLGYCLNDAGIASVNLEYLDRYMALRESPWLRSRLVQLLFRARETVGWSARQNRPAVFAETYQGRIDPIGPEETRLLALMRTAADRGPIHWYADPAKIGRIRYSFRRLRELADEHGFRPLVMIIPFLTQLDGRYPYESAHRIVRSEARARGLQVLDLTSRFMAADIESLRPNETDFVHPNEEGHRLIADALGSLLERPTRARRGQHAARLGRRGTGG